MQIYRRPHRAAATLLVTLLGLLFNSACEDDGAAQGGQPGAAQVLDFGQQVEGIYEIVDHLTNRDGCEPEGQLLTGSFPLLAVHAVSGSGHTAVSMFTCTDVESCRAGVEAVEAGRSITTNFHFTFLNWPGDGSITGTTLEVVYQGSLCHQRLTDVVLEREPGGTLRVEARSWRGEQSADGCPGVGSPLDKGGEPCAELKTFGAELVDTL